MILGPVIDAAKRYEAEARGEEAWDPTTTVFEYRRERRTSKAAQRAWPKLEKAVAKLTDAAIAAGRLDLVRDVDDWYDAVVAHMKTIDAAGFFGSTLQGGPPPKTIEEAQQWVAGPPPTKRAALRRRRCSQEREPRRRGDQRR